MLGYLLHTSTVSYRDLMYSIDVENEHGGMAGYGVLAKAS